MWLNAILILAGIAAVVLIVVVAIGMLAVWAWMRDVEQEQHGPHVFGSSTGRIHHNG